MKLILTRKDVNFESEGFWNSEVAYFKYSFHKVLLARFILYHYTNTLRRAWDKTRGDEWVIF